MDEKKYMKIVGILTEFNPFHSGHAYFLSEVRRRVGVECALMCVMSGNFVQRGEPAMLEKHVRAEAALRCGADLILELPVARALSSCLLYTSPSPRDGLLSRMPSSA